MRGLPLILALLASGTAAGARESVDASAPSSLAVTVYRDPQRGADQAMDREWPRGFAMISETRTITLPPGESTIRFEGVAEGMVAVSAIVTGLPGGTIEKNRNADLLSPASLVDGSLGNRVRITRTSPATGAQVSESAIVRTRADGGLVLETEAGFEAVRCSGLPEKLIFDRVPKGLSAQPVFTLDTRDSSGGTYTVTLTYLAWGFDWQAHYVAKLGEARRKGKRTLELMSWLTVLNDNGQNFPDAELMAVAGTLSVTSDFEALADPPEASPLRLTCYPLGSTADGSGYPMPPPPPPAPSSMAGADQIIVTAARRENMMMEAAAPAMIASEEELGDLKLYRVPQLVTVAAKQIKQVAFLDSDKVEGELSYRVSCMPWEDQPLASPVRMVLATVNDKRHGLGVALPQGGLTIFQPSPYGDILIGEERLRDHASGQDVEFGLGASSTVFGRCVTTAENNQGRTEKRLILSNAGTSDVLVRIAFGEGGSLRQKGLRRSKTKDGLQVAEVRVAANGTRELRWRLDSPE